MSKFHMPADIPHSARAEFRKNYTILTQTSEKLFLFSADHKIEHLDHDFHGPHVDPAAHDPRHLFEIAKQSPIGAMATHMGLIAQYGLLYPTIPYIVKLNGKTNIASPAHKDPFSRILWTVDDVIQLKRSSDLTILGVGVTVYLGSDYEDLMLEQAARVISHAHRHGLVSIAWIYPRGHAIKDETDPYLIAGAAGVALSLGADAVKVHLPPKSSLELLRLIVEAAGTTKVISAGGTYTEQALLLEEIRLQQTAGLSGVAIGRSIFQHSLDDAITLTKSIAALLKMH